MKLGAFLRDHQLSQGTYEVRAARESEAPRLLLSFEIREPDGDDTRHLPVLALPELPKPQDLRLVLAAAVRAGASHPGLRDEDLVKLHRAALASRHIELFADLNALTTGLLQNLAASLGPGLGRVVMSSSSIDVLHEYQSKTQGSEAHLQRNEMARALRVLDHLREHAPVHVHQLPPGSARYFQRGSAAPADAAVPGDEHLTYISEDRQMIGAYWHYVTTSNPRLPVYLVTSDFPLASVCAAERVPFLFARSPHEAYGRDPAALPQSLWFDPFALALRYCLPHALLRELCLVYREIQVIEKSAPAGGFCLRYDPKDHLPGEPEDVREGLLPTASTHDTKRKPDGTGAGKPSKGAPVEEPRKIKLSLQKIAEALPTSLEQRIPFSSFASQPVDSLRQLRMVGEQTGLFTFEAEHVVAGEALPSLLYCLRAGDYVGVNAIFRRVPAYAQMLQEVADGAPFPSSRVGGALLGWAVVLGAAYKAQGGLHYGLNEPSQERFAQAILRFHDEVGGGQAAASLPAILDRVCTELGLSPIRFEAMLTQNLGRGPLLRYEAQRATIDAGIPTHPVLVSPSSSDPASYFRAMEPGRGILLDGKLVSSLVRRPEDSR